MKRIISAMLVMVMLVWSMLVEYAFSIPIEPRGIVIPPRYQPLYGLGVVLLLVATAAALYLYYSHYREGSNRRKFQWRDVGIIIGCYLVDWVSVYVLHNYASQVLFHTGSRTWDNYIFNAAFKNPVSSNVLGLLLYYSVYIIVAPVLEEIVCRGIIGDVVLAHMPKWVKYVGTSIVFTFLHPWDNIMQMAAFFVSSLLLYYVYDRRKALIDSMVVHSLMNGLIPVLLIYLPQRL